MRTDPRWLLLVCLAGLYGCSDDSDDQRKSDAGSGKDKDSGTLDSGTPPAYSSMVYSHDENWMCKPGLNAEICSKRASASEIKPDKSHAALDVPPDANKKVDCFYLYPTAFLTQGEVGRVVEYEPIENIRPRVRDHAAAFADGCTVYAPLYHQLKISSYLDPSRDTLLEEAYAEIDDAFKHYLAQYNQGRDIVLIGHSQGAHMLRRLLQRQFDGAEHEALRKQLAVALLIGPLGDVNVPPGKLVGGSFTDIPLCSSAGERGCVITYSSYSPSKPPGGAFGLFVGGIPAGMDAGCTNPAALSGGKAKAKAAYFESMPTGASWGTIETTSTTLGVDTYYSVYQDFYSLECKKSASGISYLEVTVDKASGDQRADPIIYDSATLAIDIVGLHVHDYSFATGDLADLLHKYTE